MSPTSLPYRGGAGQGRFLPEVTTGAVRAGQVLGYVAGDNGRRDPVLARIGVNPRGALRLAAQPVQRGTGLFWIGRDRQLSVARSVG
jgi:hypothetical protein